MEVVGQQSKIIAQAGHQSDQILHESQGPIYKSPLEKLKQWISVKGLLVILAILVAMMLAPKIKAIISISNSFSGTNTLLSYQKYDYSHLKSTLLGHERQSENAFSKILWIQTQAPLSQSKMIEQLMNNHLIHVGIESGYDVRIVDNFNAYNWLSPMMVEFVRQIKHKSSYSIDVSQILRLALLIQHGGVSIKHSCILLEKLDWISQIFERRSTKLPNGVYYDEDVRSMPEVMLFFKNQEDFKIYDDQVIVARKNSKLLKESLSEISDLLLEGRWKGSYLALVQKSINAQSDSIGQKYSDNLLNKLLNIKQMFYYSNYFSSQFNLMSIDKEEGNFMSSLKTSSKIYTEMLEQIGEFERRNGKKLIIEVDITELSNKFYSILKYDRKSHLPDNSIFRQKLSDIKNNSWIGEPVPKTRPSLHYCIISLKPLPKNYHQLLNQSLGSLTRQTYKNWKALYFAEQDFQGNENVRIVKTVHSEGLNLQRAATKYCDLDDVAVILNFDERFGTDNDLSVIAQSLSLRAYFGAFLSITKNSRLYKSANGAKSIKRQFGKDNKDLMNEIANHFRVFTITSYRLLPHTLLHDNNWRYYNREIVFLNLLQMGWGYERCESNDQIIYYIKQIQQKIDIPKYRINIPIVSIVISKEKPINFELEQYRFQHRSEEFCKSIKDFHEKTGRSLEEFFILNDGKEYNEISFNKDAKIPKKIHLILIGKQLSKLKEDQYLEQTLPQYDHFRWSQDNITRYNFPFTFDIIQSLLKLQQLKGYEQIVTNLMRLEILYWQGGICVDPHYMLIRTAEIQKLLQYEAVLPAVPFPGRHQVQLNSIIATSQHYQPLMQLLDHRFLSSINFYSNEAKQLTGSILLSRLIPGNEINYQIFQSSVEYFQPNYFAQSTQEKDDCSSQNVNNPQKQNTLHGITYKGDCQNKYPWALGIHL